MTCTSLRIASSLVVFLVTSGAESGFAQGLTLSNRIILAKESTFQEELNRASAERYRVVTGDAGARLAVLERDTEGQQRSYVFAPDVEKYLNEKRLEPGLRLLSPTFGADQDKFGAIFERVEGDDRLREYRFVRVGSSGALRKRFEQAGEGSTGVVAVAAGSPGVAVIYETHPDARNAGVIASGITSTLSDAFRLASEKGHCIIDSDGSKGPIYVLEPCAAGSTSPDYQVIATTKTETFENELNAAVARGLRFVPESLIGVEKKALLAAAYNNETVGVVRQAAGAAPVSYRVLGAVRLATLAKELDAAGAEGFRVIAFTIGPKESVLVLEKR